MATPMTNVKAALNVRSLKRLRAKADLSRYQLASRSGLDYGQLWRIEAGQRGCTTETLRRVADALASRLDQPVGSVLEELTNP